MRERAPKREDGTKGEDKKQSWFQCDGEIKIVKESKKEEKKGRKGRTKTQSHWKRK